VDFEFQNAPSERSKKDNQSSENLKMKLIGCQDKNVADIFSKTCQVQLKRVEENKKKELSNIAISSSQLTETNENSSDGNS